MENSLRDEFAYVVAMLEAQIKRTTEQEEEAEESKDYDLVHYYAGATTSSEIALNLVKKALGIDKKELSNGN